MEDREEDMRENRDVRWECLECKGSKKAKQHDALNVTTNEDRQIDRRNEQRKGSGTT